MKKMKIAKREHAFLNEEKVYDRLSELYEYIENFPEGMMADAVRNEIAYLEGLI